MISFSSHRFNWRVFSSVLSSMTLFIMMGCAQESIENPTENLEVPFVSQAPEKVWVEPWLNACEETSVLMVDLYYSDEEEVNVEEAKQEILDIFEVKRQEFDESKDESLETIVELIDELELSWRAEIVDNPTIEDVLLELDDNRPVIIPVYAPELDNPHYSGGGPDYHVLVVTGYDIESELFIVNDPGTQFGDELEFSFEIVMDAIHDLNVEDYDGGAKRVLFTFPR